MTECNQINVKLLDSKLNKLKSAVKNRQHPTLRMNTRIPPPPLPTPSKEKPKKSHELLLTPRQ